MTVQVDDVHQLLHNKLTSVCSFSLGWNEFSRRAFTSIEVTGQLPGEDISTTIVRHMVDALTDGAIDK